MILTWAQIDKSIVVLSSRSRLGGGLWSRLERSKVTKAAVCLWLGTRSILIGASVRFELSSPLWLLLLLELLRGKSVLLHVLLLLLHLAVEELRSKPTGIRLLHLLLLLRLHHLHLLHPHISRLLLLLLVLLSTKATHGVKSMVFVSCRCSMRVLVVHVHYARHWILLLLRSIALHLLLPSQPAWLLLLILCRHLLLLTGARCLEVQEPIKVLFRSRLKIAECVGWLGKTDQIFVRLGSHSRSC